MIPSQTETSFLAWPRMTVDPLKRSGCPSPMRPFLLLASTFLCLMAGRLCADPLDYWTLVHSHTNAKPVSCAFGNGRFVVSVNGVGQNKVFTSTDGKDWRETYAGYVTSLAFANGIFVGTAPLDQAVVTSMDGETWVTRRLPIEMPSQVIPALGIWWITGKESGDWRLFSSGDLRVWKIVDTGGRANRVVFGDEYTLIADGYVDNRWIPKISTNGANFVDGASGMPSFNTIAKIGATWVGVEGGVTPNRNISVSTNGNDWVSFLPIPQIAGGRVFARDGRFFLVGQDKPFFMESVDGLNWTDHQVDVSVKVQDLVYGNDRLLSIARQNLTAPNREVSRFYLSRPLTSTLPEPLEASLRPAIVLRSGIVGAGYSIESATKPEGPWIHAATVFPTNFPFSVLVPDGHGERGFFRSVLRDR